MKIGLLFSKNWQKLEYKTAPKVQKLNTIQASIEEFLVFLGSTLVTLGQLFTVNLDHLN